MDNSIKHKIPKLVFNKKEPNKPFNDLSTLVFEYPEGVKHAYSFFVYPDSTVIHNDLTNEVVNAERLTQCLFKNIPFNTLEYIKPKNINSDLFHKYLEHIVTLFNSYYGNHPKQSNFKMDIHTDIQYMHRFLMSGTFDIDYSKGMVNLYSAVDECARVSSMFAINTINILWYLLPDEITVKKISFFEASVHRLFNDV